MTSKSERDEHYRLRMLAHTPAHLVSRDDKRLLMERGYWSLTAEMRGKQLFLVVRPGPAAERKKA